MRSFAIIAAGLASSVIASPLQARAVVTDIETDTAVATVVLTRTVTAGQAAPVTQTADAAPTEPAAPTQAAASTEEAQFNWGRFGHGGQGKAVWRSSNQAFATIASSGTSVEGVVVVTATQAPQPPAQTTTYAQTTTQAPAPVQTTSASAAPAPSAANDYQKAVLTHHNLHRTNHSAPKIQWSDSLAATAQTIANTCYYAHSMDVNGGGYGQNIAAGQSADRMGSIISDQWYNDELLKYTAPDTVPVNYYGMASPNMTNFESWGHFSQVVWKDTVSVGCATVQCGTLGGIPVPSDPKAPRIPPVFTVCNYSPPGNMGGEYGQNIGAPLGQPYIDGSYTG